MTSSYDDAMDDSVQLLLILSCLEPRFFLRVLNLHFPYISVEKI